MSEVDVLITGAGPTGLMLGIELAAAGVRVRIIERRIEAQQNSRALTLHPRSMEVLDQRGLADRFRAEGRTLPGWHFASLDTRLSFAALDSRHPYTLFLAQARTEELLAERAQESGVEILRGREVTALNQEAEWVDVEVRGRAGTDSMRAGFVVGCDGGRSVVRAGAGIGFPGTDETLTGMLGDFAVVEPQSLAQATESGVLVVPLESGLTRFVLMDPRRIRTPSAEPVTEAEFRDSLTYLCGTDCGIAQPRWLSRFGNATRLAERYRAGRVLVAGDAAHIHFPAAGQGLNTGLQDAMNLGWKLAAQINGWAPPGLLDTYDSERRPVGQAVTDNTEVQTLLAELTLVAEYRRPAAALRALLDELLQIGEVNRRLAGLVSALDTVYPAPAGADVLVGRRMPDIEMTDRNAKSTRVYELLHEGRFALLDLASAPNFEVTGWADRVGTFTAATHEQRADLDDVTEILVRPDGHIAWATRTLDPSKRSVERTEALTAWAGTADALSPASTAG
ncbi:monooxygenase [Nocardia sp. NPDC005998]|uniref:monooxygenase n=1 Tax=Nocardia sp. NPDC005998 TaxID=3156894 RepID=UPI0033B10913